MGFMDELRKLTQPYDDEDDFFEDSDKSLKQSPAAPAAPAQVILDEFENTFQDKSEAPAPAAKKPAKAPGEAGGFFGGFGHKRQSRPKAPQREKVVNFGGNDTQVILFNPKSFEEAGELLSHLQQNRSVVMTLEGLPTDKARRLLDFLSGITFSLDGKITPVSGKTYFITPHNVNLLDPQQDIPESDEQFF